jgi:hypothetical protein
MKPINCDLCDLAYYSDYGEIIEKKLINGELYNESKDYSNLTSFVIMNLNVCKRCFNKHKDLSYALNRKKESVNREYSKITNFKDVSNVQYEIYYLNFTRRFGKLENTIKL